jgi:hypothetical protein
VMRLEFQSSAHVLVITPEVKAQVRLEAIEL